MIKRENEKMCGVRSKESGELGKRLAELHCFYGV